MQQVNLYALELRPQKIVLPLSQITMTLAALLLVLFLFTLYYQVQVASLEARVLPEQQRIEQIQAHNDNLESRLQTVRKDEALVEQNKVLGNRVVARKQLLSMLDLVVLGNQYPFSDLMIGLARHHIDRLWLTKIDFAEGGQNVGLSGKTVKAEAVPHYLQMLREESLLLGRTFDLFQLLTDEDNRGLLHFTLSSSIIGSGANDE